jgi:CheY-like chemotaxis protein
MSTYFLTLKTWNCKQFFFILRYKSLGINSLSMKHSITDSELNILYVDDDEDDQLLFAQALLRLECPHTYIAASGYIEMLELLNQTHIDLIFLDINMPIKNGHECLEMIKSNKKYKHIPVIIFSSSENPTDINKACSLGAHHYLIKPCSYEKYIKSLATVFNDNWEVAELQPLKDNFLINAVF